MSSGGIVNLAGLPLEIVVADGARAAAVAHSLGAAPLASGPPALTLRWDEAPQPTPELPSEYRHGSLRVWHTERGIILDHGDGPTALVTADGLLLAGGGEDLARGFRRLFEPAITFLLARHGRLVLHAGAVARRGSAFLLVGGSGSGKSTLAWAALHAGWEVLSDDHVALLPPGGDIAARVGALSEQGGEEGYRVYGIPRPLAVPTAVTGERPDGARLLDRGERSRWEVSSTPLATGWRPVRGILLPAHGESVEGSLGRTRGATVMRALMSSFVAAGDHELLRLYFPHAAALSRLPAWSLRLGREEATRLAGAARWLDAAADA